MADTNTNPIDRITYEYGQGGNRDHSFELNVTLRTGEPLYPLMEYTGPDVSEDFTGDLLGAEPLTLADYVVMVFFALNVSWDQDIRIHAVRVEEINSDRLVTAIKPINLPAYEPNTGNSRSGMPGQYMSFWGYNQAGRVSKRMLAGMSSRANPMPGTFTADLGGDLTEAAMADIIRRIQAIPVAGKPVQQWGSTSQLDVDIENARIVGGFGNTIYHGQHNGWAKRFPY